MTAKYRISRAVTKSVSKIDLGTEGVPQGVIDALGADGMIKIQKNNEKIFEYASRGIYEDKHAGIRELVNNEARQGRIAIQLGHGNTHYIERAEKVSRIRPDTPCIIMSLSKSSVVIEGRNTMGMTSDEFENIYCVSGRTGNLDDTETGMFGIGKLAYRTISDTMKIETFARKSGERYGAMINGVEIRPVKSGLRHYGTRVTLKLRKNVNMEDLKKYMQNVGRFLKVDTYLRTEEWGTEQIGPISMIQHMRTNTYHNTVNEKFMISIKNKDYELVISPKSRDSITTIRGMPIQADIDLPTYFLDILNEKKYPPTATRDSLEKNTEMELQKRINADLSTYIKEKTKSENSFRDVEYTKFLIEDIDAAKYVPEQSKWRILGCKISMHTAESYKLNGYTWICNDVAYKGTADGPHNNAETWNATKDMIRGPVFSRWRRLYEVLVLIDNIYYQRPGETIYCDDEDFGSYSGVQTDVDEFEKIFEINPDAIVITYDLEEGSEQEVERMLENLGIQSATEYIGNHESAKTYEKQNKGGDNHEYNR